MSQIIHLVIYFVDTKIELPERIPEVTESMRIDQVLYMELFSKYLICTTTPIVWKYTEMKIKKRKNAQRSSI